MVLDLLSFQIKVDVLDSIMKVSLILKTAEQLITLDLCFLIPLNSLRKAGIKVTDRTVLNVTQSPNPMSIGSLLI